MSWKNSNESSRTLLYSAVVLCLTVAALFFTASLNSGDVEAASSQNAAPAAVFPGTNLGLIPDGATGGSVCGDYGAPLDVAFAVTGIEGSLLNVSIDMTISHTWGSDVWADLVAPNGTTHTIFKQRGATTPTSCTSGTPLGGTYNFIDTAPATPTFWTVPGSTVPSGNYRATAALTGATTLITPAFAGVTNPNGTWILRLRDGGEGDFGTITAANLTIEGSGGPVGPAWTNVDVNGDGQTDYGLVRDSSGGARAFDPEVRMTARQRQAATRERLANGVEGELTWYTATSNDNTIRFDVFGTSFDTIVPNDYDGDGITDIAVWRTDGGEGAFHIFESSTSTVRVEPFGQEGDDPAITGDYDGDGAADVAVYRCPITPGQCSFYYRGSNNNPTGNVTFVPWGAGQDGDFYPSVGDFDGDGKNDFCIQRSHPTIAGQGQFVLLRSSDGGSEFVNWGFDTDFIIPGDYDGDGQSDFAIRRNSGGQHIYWVLTRTGSVIAAPWGITGDISAPGDYDGDGKTDFATWRSNADPNQNWFYVFRSTDSSVSTYEFGQGPGDVPMAGWLVH